MTEYAHILVTKSDDQHITQLEPYKESTLIAAAREALDYAKRNPEEKTVFKAQETSRGYTAYGSPNHERKPIEIDLNRMLKSNPEATELDIVKALHTQAASRGR